MSAPLLEVTDLVVEFTGDSGVARAVDGVSFTIAEGEILGVVGESGSGKSITAMSVMGLVPSGRVSGSIRLRGEELTTARPRQLRRIRGKEIGMIFQDPMTALNPVHTVGRQIAEVMRVHDRGLSAREARKRSIALLELVGVPQPDQRVKQYPHQFSGGMRQRAVIAMAIANNPGLLIADEPTTALDVTIQAQILDQLRAAQAETGAATMFITHDLGVIAELAERVMVMYAGRVMEQGAVSDIFSAPRHPYTIGLLGSLPSLHREAEELTPIPGSPPSVLAPVRGCPFQSRCEHGKNREICGTTRPPLLQIGEGHTSACHFAEELPAVRGGVPLAKPKARANPQTSSETQEVAP